MLEGLVASLLNRFLGMYIRNFDAKQLNVGIWSGDVTLRNLELRREALDQLRLPVNVVEGHLGLLTLSIPWSNLKGKPVKVFIEDIYLLAAPKEESSYDEEEEARRGQALKMEKLESMEMLKERSGEGLSKEEQQKHQSFTESLVTKVVDNLQVSVKRIHLRYEDTLSAPEHPFSLGLTLGEFSAVSTDEKWNPTFIQDSVGVTHKLANLGALAIYWNTDSALLGTGKGTQIGAENQGASREEMLGQLRDFIVGAGTRSSGQHQFVLRPVNGRAMVELDKSGRHDRPKLKAGLSFEEIGVVLDEDQYRDALMMIDLFHYFIRHQEYKKYQPKGVTPKQDPKAWLKFAGNAVLDKIHDRNRRWSWAYMKERRDDRKRYIELFKKKKREQALGPAEAGELEKLEWKLTYEDLRFWRSLARRELRKETIHIKKPQEPKKSGGWGSWIWGSGKTQSQTTSDEDVVTDEHRKELYDAIEWDEKNAIAESIDVPRETVKLELDASLRTGSFTLKQDPHGRNTELLSLLFESFKATVVQRPDSMLTRVGLGGLRAYDGTTEGNLYKQIIKVKEAVGMLDCRQADQSTVSNGHPPNESDPFFEFEFEQHPLDDSADSAVTVKLKSMEIIYNPLFVSGIANFFRPPERHMESIGALMETAGATVEGFRQQTRAGLEFALQEHKTINAKLDLQAPLIIIPESVTMEKAMCMILDAGHVRVKSELVDKETIREIQSKQRQQYSEQDFQRLEGLMYDRFLLNLEATQVLLGPSIPEARAQLEKTDVSKDLHLIDRINMDFILESSILPRSPNFSKFRISGRLPLLQVSVSDRKYKRLMRLIDAATPSFNNEAEHSNPHAAQLGNEIVSTQQTAPARPQRPDALSFRPASQKELVLDEDGADKDGEDDHEKAEREQQQLVQLHRRNFEFKFTVDKLRGSLSRSDTGGKEAESLLVDVVAESFEFNFYLRPADMVAEVSLQSLVVEDHIESEATSEFKNIISSHSGPGDERKGLLYVKFIKVNKKSPELKTTYEGIETHVDVTISTITLIMTRKTLLTLLDFVLLTFQNPNNQGTSSNGSIEDVGEHDEDDANKTENTTTDSKIRVRIDLKGVESVLNSDGIRIATFSLKAADVEILLKGKTMSVGARLGNFTLLDDINQGAAPTSSLRQLITVEGSELADFRYETFDPDSGESYPGYNSLIFLRAGSIKVNFVQEPFRKIIEFFVKFGKMQAIFNSARQAAMNQANQIQENANQTRFDIVVRTPIVVFPRLSPDAARERDVLTAYLGEIYASNSFVAVDDSKHAATANKLSAGIRDIRLTSDFHFQGNESEELEIIDRVDLDFQVTYVEHTGDSERPDLEIRGTMSNLKLRITQIQLRFLMELANSVPAAFAVESGEDVQDVVHQLPSPTAEPVKTIMKTSDDADQEQTIVHLAPELGPSPGKWTKVDLIFNVQTIGLELITAKEAEPLRDIDAASLSKFSLDDTSMKLRMISDNSVESELLIRSFTIRDSRTQNTNKFRKIMSSNNKEVQQLMASFTMSGGPDRSMVVIVTIDSPKIIFALDYLFALQTFVSSGLAPANITDTDELTGSELDIKSESKPSTASLMSSEMLRRGKTPQERLTGDATKSQGPLISLSFRLNVVDAQIILIANPTTTASEAIVLSVKQVLMSQQHAMTLQISQVGIFLCRMDRFEDNRLRILDDFSLQLSMQTRSQGLQSSLTSIHLGVESLVLRLSLRDILLALQIVNKASELAANQDKLDGTETARDRRAGSPAQVQKQSTPSGRRASIGDHKSRKTARSKRASVSNAETHVVKPAILTREEMIAEIEGIRVILIGDLHELPLLDMGVREFQVDIRDWSSRMNGDTNIDLYLNVYNFSKSAWEPLVEPWQLGFHMTRDQKPQALAVDLYSRKMMELTVTPAAIALASKSANFLSQEEDVLSKPRGVDSPYHIRNYTGFDIGLWTEGSSEVEKETTKLSDGQEIPWRFEDWEKVRENLNPEGNRGTLGVRLEDSGFEDVHHIPVTGEGETMYNLRPKRDNVVHRLLAEVKLGAENVKYVTLRSPLLVENNTQIPIEMAIFDSTAGDLLKIEKIMPEDSRPAPIGAAFMHSLLVRPDQGFGYSWSSQRLHWKALLKRSTMELSCKPESGDSTSSFFFQVSANYDRNNPLTGVYPYMRIKLSAPLELQNLLPYDFKYRVYDKQTKKDWTNFLRKGGLSPVHVVELSHLLLMSIHMQDTVFKQSEFAIINPNHHEDFRREDTLVAQDNQGLPLNLKLHYFNIPDSGGAFRVSVYSPYIILNKTGLEVNIKSKSLLQPARSAAGQVAWANGSDGANRKVLPLMFSYPNDDRQNRSILRVGDSSWSKPQSFDAIGSAVEVVLPSANKHTEIHIGISVEEGEGKYKLTKVVTLASRFILKSNLQEEISFREPASARVMTLTPGELTPLHFLQQGGVKQLCLCFPGLENRWSSPFNISDLGRVHVKLAKSGQRQELIRVEIMLEHATLFLHFSRETKTWPFSIRNESNAEFMFYQAVSFTFGEHRALADPGQNPNLDEDEAGDGSAWRPIRYRLPSRSVMPYAWDYPAAERKELVLVANGKERHVSMAEIGNLLPMKVPAIQTIRKPKIIDINVVADGPNQTLILSNYSQSTSLYKQKADASSQTSLATGFEVKALNTDTTFKAQIRLAGVGISLINRQMRELAYVTFRDVELRYNESALYQTLNATIKWMQIDNQLFGGIFPLLLYPSVVPRTGKEIDVHPNLHAMITRVRDDSYGVLYIKYATILLQEMTLEIDEDFIFALLDFSKTSGMSEAGQLEGKLCDDSVDLPEPRMEQQGQDLYFELLNIQPTQLNISFVRTERVNVEDKTTSRNPLMFFLNIMTMALGNINDAPVQLNALILENARVSLPVLSQHVQSHYSQEFLYQVHKVLGSADFLGNPVGLFNNISSGVADIFYEPYQGLVMTDRPQELGIGIARGATSFVKKSVFGVTDSMSKFTGSISKGLAAATLDKQFQARRRIHRARNRPKHALYGVTEGANSFVTSVASGVGGLARKPIEGAEREGVAGFFKGVGKGVLGLATKPAIGVFDLASNVTEGIRNTTTVFDNEGLDRVRLPRFIGKDGIVRPYSQREALGQSWLKQLDGGKYFDEDYIAHLELPREEVAVMLTYTRIMLIKPKRLSVEWDVPLRDIQTISKERTGLSLTLKGGTNGPYIPIQEESSRNFLYQQIGVAVKAFNEKYLAKKQ
ncbi:MAG: hypothetical protein M1816_006969 [Peltula sp. TS41687]|nr:MAG: hypothetical protein M1816_006969 [Peltula sp. TS41687]